MEEQQSGEFAPADLATGAQDAALQERRLGAEIPFSPRCRLQHLQRPTPSHLAETHRTLRAAATGMWRNRSRRGLTILEAADTSRSPAQQRDNPLRGLPVRSIRNPNRHSSINSKYALDARAVSRLSFGLYGPQTEDPDILNVLHVLERIDRAQHGAGLRPIGRADAVRR